MYILDKLSMSVVSCKKKMQTTQYNHGREALNSANIPWLKRELDPSLTGAVPYCVGPAACLQYHQQSSQPMQVDKNYLVDNVMVQWSTMCVCVCVCVCVSNGHLFIVLFSGLFDSSSLTPLHQWVMYEGLQNTDRQVARE